MVWKLFLFENHKLDIDSTQSMQIYLEDSCIHGVDRQKASEAGYMAVNS